MEIFFEIGLIIAVAVAVSFLMRALRQPLIIGYILTGVIAGPYLFNIFSSESTFSIFSEIAISLLLFIVGLGLSPKVIKEVGKVSIVIGIGQIVFTFAIGFVICLLLGLGTVSAIYISIALTFSSTIIIMKLLSDKNDSEKLYGKIATGMLVVQDVAAVIILMLMSPLSSGDEIGGASFISLVYGLLMSAGVLLVGFYLLPYILKYSAKSQELLLLFSLGWALLIAALFGYMNFSAEIGALVAGVAVSFSPYRFEMMSRLKPIRDFFLVLFFVMLGSQMAFGNVVSNIAPIIILSLFVLVGNPIIVILLMQFMGYTKRNSFLVGLKVAQISEFSLIIMAFGMKLGHFSYDIVSIITTIGIITIAGSSYMVMYGEKLYRVFGKYISFSSHFKKKHKGEKMEKTSDIFLFGYNRIGYDLLFAVKKIGSSYMVIDYNPEIVGRLKAKGYNCAYGDADDFEFLEEIGVTHAKMIISTVPDFDTNALLTETVREKNKSATIIVVSHQIEEAEALYGLGASYVIMPHFLGAAQAAELIAKHGAQKGGFNVEKNKHRKELKDRKRLKHEHPEVMKNVV